MIKAEMAASLLTLKIVYIIFHMKLDMMILLC